MGFTSDQYIVLALLFVAGLFIGLALHPGGKKWKRKAAEAEADRRAAEERAVAAERELSEFRRRTPLHRDEVAETRDGKPVYISPNAPVTKV